MFRRPPPPPPPPAFGPFDGVLLVDKPAGPTSHDVVYKIRKGFGIEKVGHGGTLDPGATGLLIILLGKATKLSDRIMGGDKTYTGVLRLGASTDTQDDEGDVIARGDPSGVTSEALAAAMRELTGDIYQTPPMVSAVKKDGVRLYKIARSGAEVERDQRFVHIYEFTATGNLPQTANREPQTVNCEPQTANCELRTANCELRTANCEPQTANCEPQTANCEPQTANCKPQTANCKLRTANCKLLDIPIRVRCTKGVYIRTLCHDVGEALGCHGHLSGLRRLRSGRFDVADAAPLADLLALSRDGLAARVIPMTKLLGSLA